MPLPGEATWEDALRTMKVCATTWTEASETERRGKPSATGLTWRRMGSGRALMMVLRLCGVHMIQHASTYTEWLLSGAEYRLHIMRYMIRITK
jgi:hypothetical protein